MSALAISRPWGIMGITAFAELISPGRIAATAVRLSVQLLLVVFLWRALYEDTTISGGLTKAQAVSYAVLAVLAMRLRGQDRWHARDMVIQHVQYGTIVYWFLRPLSAQRYYLLRACGDQLYGFAWAAVGFAACRVVGVLAGPASAGAAIAFALTLALGQSVLYYLTLLTDQLCFWTIRNGSAVAILIFVLNLLSGGYAALWYFPGWFQALSAVLPFQATLGVPLSFFIGRLSLSDLPAQLTVEASWILVLATITRLTWRRAAERVVSQGG